MKKEAAVKTLSPSVASVQDYRTYVRKRVSEIVNYLAWISIGDFTHDVKVPPLEDEFTDVYVGVQTTLEVIREKLRELERLNSVLEKKVKYRTSALRLQRDLYDNLLRAQSDLGEGVAMLNFKGGKLFHVNDAFCMLHGITREALLSMPDYLKRTLPREEQKNFERHRRLLRAGVESAVVFESVIRRKDGKRITVEISMKAVRGNEGGNCIMVIRDITERKKAQHALQQAEEEWRSLVMNAPEIISVLNREGVILFINRTFPPLTVGQVLGTYIYHWALPEERRKLKRMIEQVFRSGEGMTAEMKGIAAHGRTGWFLTRIGPIKRTGRVINVVMFSVDITDRKETEEQLTSEMDLQKSLIQAQSDLGSGVCVFDIRTRRFTFVNDAFCRIVKYAREELFSLPNFEPLLAPAERATSSVRLIRLIKSEGTTRTERVLQRKDGSLVEVEIALQRLTGPRQSQFIAIVHDVTDKRAAERKLYENMEEISDLYNNAPCGYHSISRDHTIVQINDTELAWLGYTREELVGKKKITDLMTPQSVKKFHICFPRFMKQGWIRDLEMEYVRKDGTVMPVSVNATSIRDKDGRFIMTRTTLFDITERKRLEKKLREYNKTLQKKVIERTRELNERLKAEEHAKVKDEALLGSIGEGVVAVDARGKIIFLNEQAQKLLRVKGDALKGKLYAHSILLLDDAGNRIALEKRPLMIALKTGKKVVTDEYVCVRRDNRKFPVAITASPIILRDKVIGAISIFRDVTQEKAVDTAKEEFVSLASHQLRTPISTINWYAETLLKGRVVSVDRRQREYLEQIYGASQRMARMVNALLNVSRLELGTFSVEPEDMSMVETARAIASEIRPFVVKKKIHFNQKYDKGIPSLHLDPNLVRIIIENLLSNAIKYTPAHGKVDLDMYLAEEGDSFGGEKIDEKCAVLTVTDTGHGIPKATQGRIFTKFFRADNVKKKGHDGTGLGLYIVKLVVELMKGKIWFESEKNRGTTFYVAFPLGNNQRPHTL